MSTKIPPTECLKAAFEFSPQAQLILDADRNILAANSAAASLFGGTAGSLVGQPMLAYLNENPPAELPVEFRNRVPQLAAGSARSAGSWMTNLWTGKKRDGSIFPVQVEEQSVESGADHYCVYSITELSMQTPTEVSLRESEEQFQSMFHLSGVGMVQLDARTSRFLRVNEHFVMLTGYSEEELQKMVPGDLTHPADREADRVLVERFFRRESSCYFNEKRYVRKTGEVIWVQINASLVFDAFGHAARSIAVIQDITERKTAEIALQESEECLRQAMRVAHLGIFVHDHATDVLLFSPEMKALSGMEPDDPVSLPTWFQRVHPQDREHIKAAVQAAHDPLGKGLYDVEHRIQLTEGSTRWLRIQAQTFFEGEKQERHPVRTIGAAMDVTDEREWKSWMQGVHEQLEQKISERTEELDTERQTALKMAREAEFARKYAEDNAHALARVNSELEQFAYVASHDLQEPLRKIQAFGNLVISSYGKQLDPQGQDYLQRMGRAALRMQTLINDLLSLSRIVRKGKPFESVDLSEIIGEVLVDLESRILESHARIDVGRLPVLDADPTQMRQLFQNLIGNALKYTDPESSPRISILGEQLSPAADNHSKAFEGKDVWEIEVLDQGIGFPPAESQRIFQPFHRLHGRNEFEGTGMGLAICRRIVERHEGTIQAEGVRGQGSRFVVILPIVHLAGETGDAAEQ